MTYRVLFSPQVVRAYRSLPKDMRSRVDGALEGLGTSPHRGSRIKRLKGLLRDYYRCRVGNYRILYAISTQKREVYVDYIQHRKDVYRR